MAEINRKNNFIFVRRHVISVFPVNLQSFSLILGFRPYLNILEILQLFDIMHKNNTKKRL